jgi:hypothetical protein
MLLLLLLQASQSTPQPTPYVERWVGDLAAWVALGFLGLIGIAILYYVFTGRIDLSGLISEPNGDASMSRFQLLVFTFVIAASLFLIIASAGPPPAFPEKIPNGILVLLGISASSYLVSKGIQQSSPEGLSGRGPQVTIKSDRSETTFGGPPVQFQADVFGLSDKTVTWAIDPINFGAIDDNGKYTPPAKGDPTTVTVTATAKEDVSVSDKETVKVS